MILFEIVLIALLGLVLLMGQVWFHAKWENRGFIVRGFFLIIPWLPFFALIGIEKLIIIDILQYRINLSVLGFFAIFLSIANAYRILWSILIDIQYEQHYYGPGMLLLRISFAIVLTITVIVFLFGLAYSVATYLSGISGVNFIMEGWQGNKALAFDEFFPFFYFSAVTYFSLGYGDFVPRGSLMLFLVFMESIIGYVNSGILIAYAFNIFTRVSGRKRYW